MNSIIFIITISNKRFRGVIEKKMDTIDTKGLQSIFKKSHRLFLNSWD